MAIIESHFSGLGEVPSDIPEESIPRAFTEAVATAKSITPAGLELFTRFPTEDGDKVDVLADDIECISPHKDQPGFFRVHFKETLGIAAVTVAGAGILAARAYLRSRSSKSSN